MAEFEIKSVKNSTTCTMVGMGGDYREDGGGVPQILLGGRKGKRPPTITSSKKN